MNIPIPEALILTPEASYLRSRPDEEPDSEGQTEALYAALIYENDPPVTLYESGDAKVDGVSLLFSSDDEDTVTVGFDGAMTAVDAGTATVSASYDGGPEVLGASIAVEVEDYSEDTGTLILNLSAPNDSEVLVLIEGPPSTVEELRANQTLEIEWPAGRYEIEISSKAEFEESGSEFVEIRSVVLIHPNTVTSLERQLVLPGTCQIVGESGAILAVDGASLDIPEFAILEDTEVCLTALPPASGPWRGPWRWSPFLLPETVLITPRMDLAQPANLEIDVDSAVSTYLDEELENTRLPTYSILGERWGLGAVGEIDSEDVSVASVQLDQLGNVVAFNACPELGFTPGACRIAYDSCAGSETRSVAVDEPVCGEIADIFENVDLDTTVEEGDDVFRLPLGRAFSVRDTRSEFAICRAKPCPGGSCHCVAEADSLGCGVAFSGAFERVVSERGELIWDSFATWDLFVPNSTVCDTRFDACGAGGDVCPSDTSPECPAACPWAPPL